MLTASIINTTITTTLKMEAVNTYKTLANLYETTWYKIPEDTHLEQ
jgi:hypothetical protein